MATVSAPHRTDFDVTVSDRALSFNLPQRLGRALWAPMLAMALMAFPVAIVLAGVRANLVAQGNQLVKAAALGQFEVAAMFFGFATVFAAVSFAIARILGVLRSGGGLVQESAGRTVQTLKMPPTAKIFITLMVMAMMLILGAVIVHVLLGVQILGAAADDKAAFANLQTWSEWLEGVRRFGVSTYLFAIALGLATIVKVLGFQSVRLRELPGEPRRGG